METARFRMNRTTLLPVLVFAICLLPLTAASAWFLLVLVLPLVLAAWVVRTGFDVDDAAMGLGFKAIVHVQMTRHDRGLVKDFVRMIRTKDEVRACYATTGGSDYHLHVVCPDLDAYNRFLEDFLFTIPAVASAQTHLVLRTIKD